MGGAALRLELGSLISAIGAFERHNIQTQAIPGNEVNRPGEEGWISLRYQGFVGRINETL
jgi:hypothetical protein